MGAFGGLAVVQAIFTKSSYFVDKGIPPIIASYGASAVLIYGVLDGPLAQPRALIGGHVLAAILGTAICKLFLLLPPERFVDLQWLASSLSTATAIVLMQMTGTSHPPAGATALIPILDERVRSIGWDYVWVVLLTSLIMGAVALLTNNVSRRWPVWWIEPPAVVPGTLVWQGGKRLLKKGDGKESEKEEIEEEPMTMGSGMSPVTPPRDPTLMDAIHHAHHHGDHQGHAKKEEV